jgi:hypothetical protein
MSEAKSEGYIHIYRYYSASIRKGRQGDHPFYLKLVPTQKHF